MANAVRIAITGDESSAVRALRRTADAAERTSKTLSKAAGRFGTFGKVAAVMASKLAITGGAILASVPAVISLVNAIKPLAGGVALLPAALLGAAAAMGVFKLATAGVGKAVGLGLAGDVEKYTEALASMPPAARRFTESIVAMRKPLQAIRDEVSTRFFGQFQRQISLLGDRYLVPLRKRLGGVAEALGTWVSSFAKAARGSVFFEGVNVALLSTTRFIRGASLNVGRLTVALGHVLRVGGLAFGKLGRQLGIASGKLADFITESAKNGKLQAWITNAQKAMGRLYRIVVNVGAIVRSVFAFGGGATLLERLEALTAKARAFLASGEGKSSLAEAFGKIRAAGDAVGSAFDTVKDTVVKVAKVIGPPLLEAFEAAKPIIIDTFNHVLDAVKKILPAVADFAKALLPAIGPAIAAFHGFVDLIVDEVLPVVKRVGKWLGDNADFVRVLTVAIIGVVAALKLWAIAQAIVNAVTKANALIAVISVIVALVTAIIYMGSQTTFFADLWRNTWTGITALFTAVGNVIGAVFTGIGAGINALVGWFVDMQAGVTRAIVGVISTVTALPKRVIAIFSGALSWLVNAGTRVMTGLLTGITRAFGAVISWVTGIPGRILSGLQGLGATLFGVGADLINGLWEGLKNAAGGLLDWFKSLLTDWLPDWAKDLLGIASPSTVFARIGKQTMQGFVVGLGSQKGAVKSELTKMASTVESFAPNIAGALGDPKLAINASNTVALEARGGVGPPIVINVAVAPGADPAEVGRQAVKAIEAYERRTGHRRLAPA